uniref:Homing endonuclease LAGLIDADG domain-containing protein n=1 Tax=Caulerpa verticillata TaxID=177082 RepID=A0A386B097_9CHLO|nr:hypothetical protein [Caulerpa verticillata]AYC65083.1 hypothetical protein [Caulerpa verticillata]
MKDSKNNMDNDYEWIVGMIDGDGFLDLERTKNGNNFYYRPVLAIAQKDVKLLYKIKKILTIGRISKRKDGYYHYRVRSRKLFEHYLIPIFVKYPFLSNKKIQFKLIVRSLKILKNYSSKDIEKQRCLNKFIQLIRKARLRKVSNNKSLSQAWFVGFFDSEGCISISKIKATSQYKFTIKIKKDTFHYSLLKSIKDVLQIGHIYKERFSENKKIYYWGVTSRRQLSKLISLFNKYPLKSEKHIKWTKFLKLLRISPKSEKAQQRIRRLLLSFDFEERVPTKLKNLEK